MLKKKEIIYREILNRALFKNIIEFTQLEISKLFNISLSTTHNALKPLINMGAVSSSARSFKIINIKKILLYWATVRKLSNDIIHKGKIDMPVNKIESSLPDGVAFTAYSGYRLLYNDAPADYSEVYVYADLKTLKEIKNRFNNKGRYYNLFVLEKDKFLEGNIVPLPQIYVDLWNLSEWYAQDYLNAIEKRFFEKWK